ncbi:putative penicillolysin/deuterolysin metalloprotease [Aspergillus lucknowensis]|uniref:Neutral protease 2 n=1 Tax=Aspergillus lucknowensis TaxID=176173 RepID=A0ABR4LKH1_9EURO
MRFTTPVALLALMQGISASPVVKTNSAGLHVTLSQVDNTRIKAVVKNTGSEEVTFMHLNFFNDKAPVKKVSLFRDSNELEFQGIKYRPRTKGISEDALTSLAPGATFEDVFDIASTSDLSEGGSITLRSRGFVPVVTGKDITGSLPYDSNEITISVDGAKAAQVPNIAKILSPRTTLTGCSGSEGSALETALSNAVSLATAAAEAARSGGALFETFFKTDSSDVREDVAARLEAVAQEASSTSGGATQYYCTDEYGYCSSNVLAYTLPAYDLIANCDIYYTLLPDLASACWDQDQATTSLHEMTHAPGVYSPGTDDLGYGYDAATALSTEDALNNADSYALFANGVALGC